MSPTVWLLALTIAGRGPDMPPTEYHIVMGADERLCRQAVKDMTPPDGPAPLKPRCLPAADLGRKGKR